MKNIRIKEEVMKRAIPVICGRFKKPMIAVFESDELGMFRFKQAERIDGTTNVLAPDPEAFNSEDFIWSGFRCPWCSSGPGTNICSCGAIYCDGGWVRAISPPDPSKEERQCPACDEVKVLSQNGKEVTIYGFASARPALLGGFRKMIGGHR